MNHINQAIVPTERAFEIEVDIQFLVDVTLDDARTVKRGYNEQNKKEKNSWSSVVDM